MDNTTNNDVAHVRQLLGSDRRLSIKMVATELNLSATVVFPIVPEDLAMRKVGAKFIPTEHQTGGNFK